MSDPLTLQNDGTSRGWRGAAIVFVVAVAARVAFGLYAHHGSGAASLTFDDERWYWALGESYARGEGFVGEFGHRAERMPLYPWILSWFAGFETGPAMARVAQWLLSSLAASLTYLLARRLGAAAMIAGLIVAFDPSLAGTASLLLTESLHVVALACLWLIAWPLASSQSSRVVRWLAAALVAACSVYLREASLVFVAGLFVFIALARRDRRAIGASAVSLLLLACSLLPWAYRNRMILGEWCWLTTRGGISLYDGVRPGATGAGDLAGVKDAPDVQGLSEIEWDRHFQSAAHQAISDDPWRIAALAPRKLARTWSPVLHAEEYRSPVIRFIFAAWYIPLYALALMGMILWRQRLVTLVYLLLPIASVCMLHMVFVGSVRYRLPAIPAVAVLAAFGSSAIQAHIRGERAKTGTDPLGS